MPVTYTYTSPLTEDFDARRAPEVAIRMRSQGDVTSAELDVQPPEPDFGLFTIYEPITGRKLFDGSVARYTNRYEDDPVNHVHGVVGMDHTWAFNKYRPFGNWTDVSATLIVSGLVSGYAPGFTINHVQTGLSPIDFSCDGSETLLQAVIRVSQVLGDARCYLDADQDVHFFHVDLPTLPSPPTGLRPAPATAMTIAQSATNITGSYGSQPTWRVYTYAFYYDDGVISAFAPWSAPVYFNGAKQTDYAGLLTGAAVSGHSVTKRIIWELSNIGCRTMEVWNAVADNTTTAGTIDFYANPNPNVSSPYEPFVQVLAQPTTPAAAPAHAPTVADGAFDGIAYTAGNYRFALAFINDQGEESGLGPSSATWATDGSSKSPDFSNLDLGPAGTVFRKIYATNWPTAAPDFTTNPYAITGWLYVPDNVSTSLSTATQTALGVVLPNNGVPLGTARNFTDAGWPLATPIPASGSSTLGPDPELDETPEDVTDSSSLLLKDPPFQVVYDKTQVRNRVFVRGAAVNATAAAAIGATAIAVPAGHPFSGAGQIQAKNRVYTYDYAASTALHLTTGMIDALASGDPVYIWVQADHLPSQAFFAAREDDDGVHEYTVKNTSLTTIVACGRRAQAEVAIYGLPFAEVRYATRDVKSRPGKTVAINMVNPRCVENLLIQSVDVGQVHVTDDDDGNEQLLPRFIVTASSVRFTVDDFMRSAILVDNAGLNPSTGYN